MKFKRPNPNKLAVFGAPPELAGGVYAFGRIGCLCENTKIYVVENNKIVEKKIKKLKDSFTVLSFNFNKNKIEEKKAIKIASGKKEVYEIEFNNGSKIYATGDHIFYNKNLKEIKTKDIKSKDLLVYNQCNIKNRNVWSKKEVIERIRSKNKEKTWWRNNKEMYYEIIALSKLGFDNKQISRKLLPKYKKYFNCYKVAEHYNNLKLSKRLKLNFEERRREICRNSRKNQDYSYMLGEKNVSHMPEVRKKLSINWHKYEKMHKKYAKKLGKSNKGKLSGDKNPSKRLDVRKKISENIKKAFQNQEIRNKFSGENNGNFGKITYPTPYRNKKLKHMIRSKWEEAVCLKLIKNKIKYKYEPKYFKLKIDNKITSYTPDLKVKDFYIEIKGPLYDWQIKKMEEFQKNNKLILITHPRNFKKLSNFKNINYFNFILEDYDANEIFKS